MGTLSEGKIWNLSNDEGHGSENVSKKNFAFSDFVVIIPIRFNCQMWVYFPGIEYLGRSYSGFKGERKIPP